MDRGSPAQAPPGQPEASPGLILPGPEQAPAQLVLRAARGRENLPAGDDDFEPPILRPIRSADSWCCTPDRRSCDRFAATTRPDPLKLPRSRRCTRWSRRNSDGILASAFGTGERAADIREKDSLPARDCHAPESHLRKRQTIL